MTMAGKRGAAHALRPEFPLLTAALLLSSFVFTASASAELGEAKGGRSLSEPERCLTSLGFSEYILEARDLDKLCEYLQEQLALAFMTETTHPPVGARPSRYFMEFSCEDEAFRAPIYKSTRFRVEVWYNEHTDYYTGEKERCGGLSLVIPF